MLAMLEMIRATRTRTARFAMLLASFFTVLSFVTEAHAEPLDPKGVPEPLKPWTGWALRGKADALCPTLHGLGTAQCAWPSRLDLVLDEKKGAFTQRWHVDAHVWVPLPGNDKR